MEHNEQSYGSVYDELKFDICNNRQCLTVTEEQSHRIDLSELERYLYAKQFVNFDYERIVVVVKRAMGEPEEIGPVFRKYNREKERFINIKTDVLEATVRLMPQAPGDDPVNEYDVIYKLRSMNIPREFILVDNIRKSIKEKNYRNAFPGAVGKKPINGEDAKMIYKFKKDQSGKPIELENGRADLRTLNKVIMAQKDQVLVEKIPATEGTVGYNVFGEEIPATPGNDETIPKGKNTEVSSDGLKLYSLIDGFVYVSELGVNVGDIFTVEGDLDYATGNIKYKNDVYIKKNVLPGFVIETEGNIVIDGDMESATLIATNGDITVKKGVFGESKIVAGKKVTLSFVQGESSVKGKEVEVEKFSYGATVYGVDVVSVKKVMGGEIISEKFIHTESVGSEQNIKTVLKIWDSNLDKLYETIERYEEQKVKAMQGLEMLSAKLQGYKKVFAVSQNLSDSAKAKISKLLPEFNRYKKVVELIEENLSKCNDEIRNIKSKKGHIQIESEVFSNTRIAFYDHEIIIRENLSGKKVYSNEFADDKLEILEDSGPDPHS